MAKKGARAIEKIFLVIVNYNGGQDILLCIRSITRHCKARYPILVIDNASTDGSRQEIHSLFPEIDLVALKKNVGYGRAANIGIEKALSARADAVVVLHHDVIVFDDFVAQLAQNRASLVGPILSWQREGRSFYTLGGKIIWPWGYLHENVAQHRPPAFNKKVDFIPGACMLLRRDAIRAIGLFSEEYFLFFEDVDYAIRAAKVDVRLAIESKSLVFHQQQAKLKTGNVNRSYYTLRNQFFFLFAFGKKFSWISGLCFILGLSVLHLAQGLPSSRWWEIMRAVCAAWVDALRGHAGAR